MNKETAGFTSSVGIGTLTFAVLLVLKFIGEIEMSWFWVLTSIIWVPLATFLALMVFIFFFLLFIGVIVIIFDKLSSW